MSERTYVRIRWQHSSPADPVELWSELDQNREEVRKVEIWADGRVGYASRDREAGETRLGERAVPPLNEIAADAQFYPKTITRSEFEECWAANVRCPPLADIRLANRRPVRLNVCRLRQS